MKKQKELSSEGIEFQSLTTEISQKSLMIARLNAQIYKLAAENAELKKRLKTNSNSTKGNK